MKNLTNRFVSFMLVFALALSLSAPAFAADASPANSPEHTTATEEQTSNLFSSPDSYIKYLESFGDEYSVFLSQFKTLPLENNKQCSMFYQMVEHLM